MDTGYSGSLALPGSVAAALGLVRRSGGRAVLADGSSRQFDMLVVVLRCFLHGWLSIRDRYEKHPQFHTLSEKVWHAYHAEDRRTFGPRLRRRRVDTPRGNRGARKDPFAEHGADFVEQRVRRAIRVMAIVGMIEEQS